MKLPINISFRKVDNVDKKQNERDDITRKVYLQQLYRENENIKKWRDAIELAERIDYPCQTDLIRIFNDVELDPHVISVLGTRRNSLLSAKWNILDSSGEVDEDLTKMLNKQWFYDLRKSIIDARFYGYTLVQLGDIKNNEFIGNKEVLREYVVPSKNAVKPNLYGWSEGDLVYFDQKPYDKWTLFFSIDGLGLLNNIAPYAIYKKNSIGFWGRNNELFGMPIRIGKTDILNNELRENMGAMLKNMSSAAWGVFDKNDVIEFVEKGKEGVPTYKDLIELSDKQISKAVLGQTMTTEDGSSKSQSEVHERTQNIYTSDDKTFETHQVNNKVIPLLVYHGILPDGSMFEHEYIENISTDNKVKYITEMTKAGYVFEPDFVEQYTGLEVAGVKSFNPVENASIINEMNNLYKNV